MFGTVDEKGGRGIHERVNDHACDAFALASQHTRDYSAWSKNLVGCTTSVSTVGAVETATDVGCGLPPAQVVLLASSVAASLGAFFFHGHLWKLSDFQIHLRQVR